MKNIINNRPKFMLALGLALSLTACTDTWDDHYEVETHGDGTLWETMSANSEISNFQKVLEACGLKETLDGSQVCTVFAPVNSSFTEDMADSVIELYNEEKARGVKTARNAAIKEFVRNHVALYNYSVSSVTNDSIQMMNGKYLTLSNSRFAKSSIQSKNILTNNGVLFIVDQMAQYLPNVYEGLNRESDLDSICHYIYQYSVDVFSPTQSVPGDIIDGKTHYLDSVTYQENDLLTGILRADIENEDSTYWMLAPTNRVWTDLINEYEQYYKYDATIKGRDSLMYAYPRHAIVKGTIFSKKINQDQSINDSILSTNGYAFSYRYYAWGSYALKYYQFDKPFAKGGIFYGTQQRECSNGIIFKADNWNVNKRNTFLRNIVMEGASNLTIDSVYLENTVYPVSQMVTKTSEFYNKIHNNTYIEIAPTASTNIECLFDIRNVLSNQPYDIYLVTIPMNGAGFKFKCAIQCNNTFGEEMWIKPDLYNEDPVLIDDTCKVIEAAKFISNNPNYEPKDKSFVSNRNNIDSVFIGTFSFPTCSYNTTKPQVKLYIQGNVRPSEQRKGTYSQTLYMDCILAIPCEGENCPHHNRMSK